MRPGDHTLDSHPDPGDHPTRRDFLRTSATFGGLWLSPLTDPTTTRKLRIGVIGCGNRGAANLNGVAGEDIVALCDVDAHQLATAVTRFPAAKTFVDFRDLLRLDDLDASPFQDRSQDLPRIVRFVDDQYAMMFRLF